ncbi:MAG: ankyrin repeat domain-containing protein [Flavobacteriaceae bacterium]|nr:ankyrin repeat domain-containing protein [Flavobacteriaceae bacterium]
MKKSILSLVVLVLFSYSSIAGNLNTASKDAISIKKYSSTFFNLIKDGKIDAVKNMLEAKSVKINKIVDGKTAIIVAIENDRIDILILLIDKGAKLNKKAKNGITALMYCAKYNKTKSMKIILDKGAKTGIRSSNGYKAIDYAKMSKAIDCAKMLE